MKETIFYLPFFKKDGKMLTILVMYTVLIIGNFYELDDEEFFSRMVVFGGIFLFILVCVVLPVPLIKITDDAIYYSSKLRTDIVIGGLRNNLYPLFDPLTFEVKIEHIASVSEETYIFTLTKEGYLEEHLKLLSEQYLALVKSEKRPPDFLLLLEKLSHEDRHNFFSILKTKLK